MADERSEDERPEFDFKNDVQLTLIIYMKSGQLRLLKEKNMQMKFLI